MNWYNDPQYIPDTVKQLSEAEAAYALREAWFRIYNKYPSDNSLAILWAKACLETGRWKHIHCYNFGNIKKKRNPDDGFFFTMYECGEEVSLSIANDLVKKDNSLVKILKTYSSADGSKRASIKILPPHAWTHFRATKTVEDGAEQYIRFVSQSSRYAKAWQKVIEGDPRGYSHELKIAGYYTASETLYTSGVIRLFNEFQKRKEEFLNYKHDTEPAPPLLEDSSPEIPVMITDTIPPETIKDIHDTDKDIDTEVSNGVPDPNILNPVTDPITSYKIQKFIALTIAAIVGAVSSLLVNSCSWFGF
ncbi:MAG: hypothetical protein WC942_04600 [Clostridia bacterium]|jgi:hypothetical protein